MKATPPALLIAVISVALTSCTWFKSVDTRLTEARTVVEGQYKEEVLRQRMNVQGGVYQAGWDKAVNDLFRHNPNLIQADFRVVDTKTQGNQIWRNMIPGLSAGATDSFRIEDFGSALTNTSYRLNSFLSLGNLVSLPKQIYVQKLRYLGSQLQAEQAMRQEIIGLYRLFQQERLLAVEKRAIDLQGGIANTASADDMVELATLQLQYKADLEAWQDKEKEWRTQVGDSFMASFREVDLYEKGLPEIRYDPNALDFADSRRWGNLQMNLLALEKIADDNRIREAYLRYVPSGNFSVSAPPLFSSNSRTGFDPALVRLSPSLYWNLDTRGSISQQIDRIKRQTPIDDWQKDRRRSQEITKLIEGKQALRDVRLELAKTRVVIENYKQMVKGGLIEDPRKAIETMRNLKLKEVTLMAKDIDICTSFWLIDEDRWKSLTRRWHDAREVRLDSPKKKS